MGRNRDGAEQHTAGTGQALAVVMMPTRRTLIGEMMVRVHGPMIVIMAVGMRKHRGGQHILGQARCRAAAKRKRHGGRDDTEQVDRCRDPPGQQPS